MLPPRLPAVIKNVEGSLPFDSKNLSTAGSKPERDSLKNSIHMPTSSYRPSLHSGTLASSGKYMNSTSGSWYCANDRNSTSQSVKRSSSCASDRPAHPDADSRFSDEEAGSQDRLWYSSFSKVIPSMSPSQKREAAVGLSTRFVCAGGLHTNGLMASR